MSQRTGCVGNSAREYALPLVVFVLTGTLLAILMDVPGQIARFAGQTTNGAVENRELIVPALGTPVVLREAPLYEVPGLTTVTLTLGNGKKVVIQNYPTDLKAAVETAGGNGTTKLLLANMEALVKALKSDNTIPPEQIGVLEGISNQGHRIAEVERLLQKAANQATNSEHFNTITVTFEGEERLAYQLAHDIGFYGRDATPGEVAAIGGLLESDSPNAEPGEMLAHFINLYNEAVDNGALEDPVAREVVTLLAEQISFIAETSEMAARNIEHGALKPDEFRFSQASDATHIGAVGICVTGAGEDTGIHCSNDP